MQLRIAMVMLLNFGVDLLLLLGTNRLLGFCGSPVRCLFGATLAGVYGGACVVSGLRFLGNGIWYAVFLALVSGISFGVELSALRRALVFVLLRTTLGGAVMGLEKGNLGALLPVAAVIGLLCLLCAPSGGLQQLVEVELWAGEKCERLLALLDTGNTLTDPVTGSSVLVADARTAEVLLGLTAQQLARPVETMAAGAVKGLRLIPYRSVGQAEGLLLAVRLDRVRVGRRKGSAVVAFAPEGLGGEGSYRALVGGMLCG